jgi:pimeloyl-ACP methyl ester carboxylesterase
MARGGRAQAAYRVMVSALVVALLAGCALTEDTPSSGRATVRAVEEVRLGDVAGVRVAGHRFATRCAGDTDAPGVLLVAAEGTPMAKAWPTSVQGRIGAFARVCAYDRLGVGRSGRAPAAQTFVDMAKDLLGVVDKLEMRGRVLLVGQSLGGMVAATAAAQAPDRVAGLLLLDAAGPGYPQAVLDRLPVAGRHGGPERQVWSDLRSPSANPEHLDGRRAFEAAASLDLRDDVRLVALTHSIAEHPQSTSPRQQADLESAWEAGQNQWLDLSSAGRLKRVDLAGHDIAADRPDLVVDRVRGLLPR